MANKEKRKITEEDVKRFIVELQDMSYLDHWHPKKAKEVPEPWEAFFGFEDIEGILRKAINATCTQGHITLEDFKFAIFEYTVVGYNWLAKKSEDHSPEAFRGFIKKVIRGLLVNVTFMRDYFGIRMIREKKVDEETGEALIDEITGKKKTVVKMDTRSVSIDETPEDGRPLSERLSTESEDQKADAKEKLEFFKSIVRSLESNPKYSKFGELLRRYYLLDEEIGVIAVDFLRRGIISVRGWERSCKEIPEAIILSAKKNLQNRLLPRAREKFNSKALSWDLDLHF